MLPNSESQRHPTCPVLIFRLCRVLLTLVIELIQLAIVTPQAIKFDNWPIEANNSQGPAKARKGSINSASAQGLTRSTLQYMIQRRLPEHGSHNKSNLAYKIRVNAGGMAEDWIEVGLDKGRNNPEPLSVDIADCLRYYYNV